MILPVEHVTAFTNQAALYYIAAIEAPEGVYNTTHLDLRYALQRLEYWGIPAEYFYAALDSYYEERP